MKPPAFWYAPQSAPGFWPYVLSPLSALWRFGAARRHAKGRHLRVPVPVICVGNINIGGTGKTPTVIALLGLLAEMGMRPHVVSKGYGGQAIGPLRVDEVTHTASDVGDEPLLLAAFGPCWVAKDRAAGAEAAVAAGADVIILDDGMQNPDLVKDFTITVVDAAVGFGNGRVLPAGPLRQTLESGLAQADMVLSIGPPEAQKAFATAWPDLGGVPLLRAELKPLETGMLWQDLRAFAFAGIGRPEKFFETLRASGATVVATRSFGDHETLSDTLLKRMESEAESLSAQMVTTEKDAVRLPRSFRHKVVTLPVRLSVEEPERLAELLEPVVARN
ncbi:tetraacyldisaccharide 4'-kinase [Neptunicoccus cionae]|uniref:tetraacyldisaccharide 4'-kinase n=1 Tax=Neptunicoccus cionae TaxID=2035344 RepID=UPI000C78784A|nr:tetraacyldisaccharide 4'-kinase [Amylibacter cionae]PLS22892.1 tetraacyldisaccharide 4'-kinase [Amylibacter cionae]